MSSLTGSRRLRFARQSLPIKLSTYAHNVKVITLKGTVTLKGPVKSEEEKQKVASMAANVVSADKVTDELTVKP
jgi:hyperosmotically inducible protein